MKTHSSLASQTYKNWWHFVIDGESDDGTVEVLNSLPRIKLKVLSERDSGIYDAMNKGLKLIDLNTYVVFLNAGDEFVSDEALQTLARRLRENNFPQLMCSTHEEIEPDGQRWVCKLVSKPSIQNQLYAYGYRSHQGVFFHGKLISEIGYFNLNYKIASDWDWITRAFSIIKPATIPESIIKFETGGFSSLNILKAHRELRELRSIYLWKNNLDRFWDDIYCAIYLRNLGFKNYLSYLFYPFLLFLKVCSFFLKKLIRLRMFLPRASVQAIGLSLNWKGRVVRRIFRILFFNPYTLVPIGFKYLHKKLRLNPLEKA